MHQALEEQLRSAAETSEAIRSVVDERQYQVPYLIEDLELDSLGLLTLAVEVAAFSTTFSAHGC